MKKARKTATRKRRDEPPDPVKAFRTFIDEQQALEKALERAETRVPEAEAAHREARLAFGNSHAASLKNDLEGPVAADDGTAEGKALLQATANLEAARAARGSLSRQLKERDADVLAMSERLKAAREKHAEKACKKWLADEFQPAVEAYRAVLRRGHALAASFALSLSPDDEEGTLGAALLRVPDPGNWESDKAAKKLYDDHSDLLELERRLAEAKRKADQRAFIAKRIRNDYGRSKIFDASPSAKYRCRLPVRYFEKSFDPGDIVTLNEIDIGTLAKLVSVRHLILEPPEDEWEA